MGLHVIVIGNPFDGLRIYGPYNTIEEAEIEAESFSDTDWWIVPLDALP